MLSIELKIHSDSIGGVSVFRGFSSENISAVRNTRRQDIF
jgi:hypothetical protein